MRPARHSRAALSSRLALPAPARPGANRKVRSQKASGKGRMGRRKAPGKPGARRDNATHSLRLLHRPLLAVCLWKV